MQLERLYAPVANDFKFALLQILLCYRQNRREDKLYREELLHHFQLE